MERCTVGKEVSATDHALDGVDEIVRELMERHLVPGLALGVRTVDGVRERAYGVSSIESGYPVLPISLFQIGSISKVCTTTLVLQLVDEGKLDLALPVMTWLPDLRLADAEAQRTVTLTHLLTHTSGLDGDAFDAVPEAGCDDQTIVRMPSQLDGLEQLTPPGELVTYCNIGFAIAGAAVARVLGCPFEQAMRERVFAPLGMDRSFYFPAEAIAYPMTVGHQPASPGSRDLTVIRRWYPWERWTYPDGAINAPVGDLLRFADFHLADGRAPDGRQLFSTERARLMRVPHHRLHSLESVGLGWWLPAVDGPTVVMHDGGTHGWRSVLYVVPEAGVAVTVCVNSSSGGQAADGVAHWVLSRLCDVRFRTVTPIELPPAQLARFGGRYANPRTRAEVTISDGALMVTTTNSDLETGELVTAPPRAYLPVSDTEFWSADGHRIAFLVDTAGTPARIRLGTRLADRVAGA
jgi:CubicO group peptidase (beta-lactamase class C family)